MFRPPSREAAFAAEVAESARRFPPPEGSRAALGKLVRDGYGRMGRPVPAAARPLVDGAPGPLVQIAHDGQLPHLGILRLVLKTAEVARLAGGVAVYLVGDHYTASMRPRNVYFGMPLRGISPDDVKQPIRLPISGRDKEVPFLFLRPPTRAHVASMYDRAWDWMEKNIAFERSLDAKVSQVEAIRGRFETWKERLAGEATQAESLSDWLLRVQLLLFDELFQDDWPPLVLVPMSRFRRVVSGALLEAVRAAPTVDPEAGVWLHCPGCHRRSRPIVAGDVVRLRCPGCGAQTEEPLDPAGTNQFPDIVTYEAAALPLFAGWLVGSRADYLPRIDALHASRWGRDSPPRAVLESVPVFRGLGEPEGGYGRSRALRVLLETGGREILDGLAEPWESNPKLHSAHLTLRTSTQAKRSRS